MDSKLLLHLLLKMETMDSQGLPTLMLLLLLLL
jgi:hypothetical protein